MPISQDEGIAVRSTARGVLERPKPAVGVVLRGGDDRSVIGEQLAYAVVLRYFDSMDAIGGAMGGGPIDVVVTDADTLRAGIAGWRRRGAEGGLGRVPVVVYDRADRLTIDALPALMVPGLRIEFVVRPAEPLLPALRRVMAGRAAIECGAGDSAAVVAVGAVAAPRVSRDRGAQGDEWAWSGSTRAVEPGVAEDGGAAAGAIGVGDGAGGIADRAGAGRGVVDVGAWVAGAADPAAEEFRAFELHHAAHAAVSGWTDAGWRAGGSGLRDRARVRVQRARASGCEPTRATRQSRLG